MRKLEFDGRIIEVCDKHVPNFLEMNCDDIECVDCELDGVVCLMQHITPTNFWSSVKIVTEEMEMEFKVSSRVTIKSSLVSCKQYGKCVCSESMVIFSGCEAEVIEVLLNHYLLKIEYAGKESTSMYWTDEMLELVEQPKTTKITLKRDYKEGEEIQILDGEIVEKPGWTLEKILACDDICFGCSFKNANHSKFDKDNVIVRKYAGGIDFVSPSNIYPSEVDGFTADTNYSKFKFFKRNGEEILPC